MIREGKMKSFVIVFLSLICIVLPSESYSSAIIGIWADSTASYNAYCPFEGDMAFAEIYIIVDFDGEYVMALSFGLSVPSNVIMINYPESNGPICDISYNMEWPTVLVVSIMSNAIVSPTWIVRQQILITSDESSWIEFNSDNPPTYYDGYVSHSMGIVTPLGINIDSGCFVACKPPTEVVVGNAESSWGAIKSQYK